MESQFFTSFLMISDWRTVLFLAVLAVLFGLIVTNSIMIDKQLGTLDITKYNSH